MHALSCCGMIFFAYSWLMKLNFFNFLRKCFYIYHYFLQLPTTTTPVYTFADEGLVSEENKVVGPGDAEAKQGREPRSEDVYSSAADEDVLLKSEL